jgi:hypothetical protein
VAVVSATALGQVIVLARQASVVMQPDSASYLAYARHLRSGHLTDTFRTFGYPVVLAVLGVRGTQVVQIIAMSAVPLILWSLVYRTTGNRIAAGLCGIVVALDVYAVQWERVVGTEALAYASVGVWAWLVVRLVERRVGVVPTAAVAAWLVVLRPILLPIVLLVGALAALRLGRRALVLLALPIVPVVALTLANGIVHGKWTMTTVATGNVTGKVFRYGMQAEATPDRFRDVRAAAMRAHFDGTQASFYESAPSVSPDRGTAWGLSVATNHPFDYTRHSIRELVDVWVLQPVPYTGWTTSYVTRVERIAVWAAYLLLPAVAIAGVMRRDLTVVILAIIVIALLAVLAFDEYIDLERVRMPVEALAIAGVACAYGGIFSDRRRAALAMPLSRAAQGD